MQSAPLYRQASLDCKRHDYRHAADLLQQLAQTPGLALDAVAFCNTQRALCLKDAGLPVPASPAVVAASLSVRASVDAD